MVAGRLREVMLRADGAGRLAGEGVALGSAEHPVCGDHVELSLRLADGRIADLGFLARGCPAATAVAALAVQDLRGSAPAEAPARLRAAIGAAGGLAAHERHAEGLVLRALAQALAAGGG
ncbi:MAG: hypothetical protein FJ265_03415 [Planctomycetes bacterium]|nr:hypothetical protein [Planctomycetota bacterium]